MCVQEAAYRSKAEDRDMARNAVGVLGGRDDSERRRRQQYAADLEDQMRAKQVGFVDSVNAVQALGPINNSLPRFVLATGGGVSVEGRGSGSRSQRCGCVRWPRRQ